MCFLRPAGGRVLFVMQITNERQKTDQQSILGYSSFQVGCSGDRPGDLPTLPPTNLIPSSIAKERGHSGYEVMGFCSHSKVKLAENQPCGENFIQYSHLTDCRRSVR